MLEVYCGPADPRRPVVCLDEMSTQLIGEVEQLNIHALSSLHEAFPPQEARRIADGWKSITRPSTDRG